MKWLRAASSSCCWAAVLAGSVSGAAPSSDGLEELARAVARFRGVGHEDVSSYRVLVRLPDDPEGEASPLLEMWRAPSDLAVQAAEPGVPRAVVRGLAMYLEPLYVARASLLGTDLEASVRRLRETCTVSSVAEGAQARVKIAFPAAPDPELPVELADLARLDALLDGDARLVTLQLETREGDRIGLTCEYGGKAFLTQPSRARWTLPNDEFVEIRTAFRSRAGRMLPESRSISFPSRYAPGETEEIRVRYEKWELDAALDDASFTSPGAFRYDADGLVGED
jgi:hypothetical protein